MQRLFVLLAFTALIASGLAFTGCPAGYSTFDNKACYKFSPYPLLNRTDAGAACNSEGGYLASINDGFTSAFIYNLTLPGYRKALWFGLQCFGPKKTTCINDDGTRFGSYDNFAPGEPSYMSHCIVLMTNGFGSAWSSEGCYVDHSYVCEVPYKAATGSMTSKSDGISSSRLLFKQN